MKLSRRYQTPKLCYFKGILDGDNSLSTSADPRSDQTARSVQSDLGSTVSERGF